MSKTADPAPVERLGTARLLLRAARADELEALHRIYSDRAAMRYWDSLPHRTLDDTRPVHHRLSQPGPRRYFVWDHEGTIIGCGGIHSRRELGFILHPDHWGEGFAHEGAQAVLDHIWSTSDWDFVTAEADPRNLGSVGLLTRLGFRVTGFAHRNCQVGDRWTDSVYLTIDRPKAIGGKTD